MKNYIFDFDGTLMDTSEVILSTIKSTVKELKLPEKSVDEYKSIIGIRTDEAGRYLYPELDISNKDFARTFRANYDRLKRNALEKTFPGVIDTLTILKAKGHSLAIASSRRLSSLYDYLDGLHIREWFDMVVGADSVTKGKPNPEPVITILNALDWNAHDTLVVGDADVDIIMGNSAGCHTCAVTYGNGAVSSLKAARPTHIIDHFSDLLNIP
ncbi:MAG: HAD family hydrolase [Clostridiales bacterium]|nr:HAD family hydrolase [Clostridiales bacterium]